MSAAYDTVAALRYVRTFFPTIEGVVIRDDGRWMFFTPTNGVPIFPTSLDVSVLEETLADAPTGVYFMPLTPECEQCHRDLTDREAADAYRQHLQVLCEACAR